MSQFVYQFSEGSKQMKPLLGGKGANLAEMTRMGLPVPSGFTITTEACTQYFKDNNQINDYMRAEIEKAVDVLEATVGKQFDGNPCLLVSVRSGAVISMPGMMDTVLNLGLNDNNLKVVATKTESMRFALDCYRRFIQMYGSVVLGIPIYHFESILEEAKEAHGADSDQDLTESQLQAIIQQYKAVVLRETGSPFEQDPKKQLFAAIEAVFRSWDNERAIIYRQLNNIPAEIGTAVNVQMMVFGNMGNSSGTGVAFTRNPSTGEKALFGEFLMNAQGEDVVAGIRTPHPIANLAQINEAVFNELNHTAAILENHYNNMQDLEFTIENGKFFMLQTRNGKRSAAAAIKIALDFVAEGIISKAEAINQLDLAQIDQLLHPEFDEEKLNNAQAIAKGLPASPGAAFGQIYFNSQAAFQAKEDGQHVILVRQETSPEDIQGMASADGILTARGGMTSHAAVVARGMGKCCVSGCSELEIDEKKARLKVGGIELVEGDFLSLDGNTGKVYVGKIETRSPNLDEGFMRVLDWADELSQMSVWANADTPTDAERSIKFGAKGIGLCRTEHMFFDKQRIRDMREMIMAADTEGRKAALDKLYPYQKEDFKGIYKVMGTLPVNIRLLDPPLHEFLPHAEEEIKEMASQMNISQEEIVKVIEKLEEVNPMMGLRGCRLGIIYPEVYAMQAKAIVDAAMEVQREDNFTPVPEIMIPLVGSEQELARLRTLVEHVIKQQDPTGQLGKIKIGTMIEIPRACLVADHIAQSADYFSFGTNDLTQMTLGYSRDDAGRFIRVYSKEKILAADPFQVLDTDGVGQLMEMAVTKGRQVTSNLEIGVCGEQGGDPESVAFLNQLGINYVSCSPFRIPKARLAAAQAVIRQQ